MGLRSWLSGWSQTTKSAVIGGVFVFGAATAAAAVAGVFNSSAASHERPITISAPIASPITSPASPPGLPPACPKKLQLNAPTNGQHVAGRDGVEVKGTACDLQTGESVWVFEFDAYDSNYYLVYDPNVGRHAASLMNGDFAIPDKPIGDPGDSGKVYTITAVLASAQCSASIMAKPIDAAGNYVFQPLPAGCQALDQKQIFETQPN